MIGKPTDEADPDALRARLRTELDDIVRDLAEPGTEVDRSRIRRARDLAAVLKLHDAATPPSRGSRAWSLAIVFVGLLVGASVLFSIHVRSTKISLVGTASSVVFVSATKGYAFEPFVGTQLLLAHAAAADGPLFVTWRSSYEGPLRLTALDTSSTITLDAIAVRAGDTIAVRSATGRGVSISLRATAKDTISLATSIVGKLNIRAGDGYSASHDFESPDQLALSRAHAMDAQITPYKKERLVSRVPWRVSYVSFATVRGEPSAEGGIDTVSSLHGASLSFLALGSSRREIGPTEHVQFDVKNGLFRRLEADADTIRFHFEGDVSRAVINNGSVDQNVMPTLFEWLRARQSVGLIWGAAVYLFGLFLAARQWWLREK